MRTYIYYIEIYIINYIFLTLPQIGLMYSGDENTTKIIVKRLELIDCFTKMFVRTMFVDLL